MKFNHHEPITELIWELNKEVGEWCRKRKCSICFEGACFKLDSIRKCKKLPKLYKLYWEAKGKNILVLSPLILYRRPYKDEEKE